MTKSARLWKQIDDIVAARNLRAPSLIITVLGDSIEPHGGTFWLGSLIDLLGPLRINERLVRTSIFRLAKEGWVSSNLVGRRSYYSLTRQSLKRFEEAFERVYSEPEEAWDGEWTFLITAPSGVPSETREALRREFLWQGFGAVATGVLAHPSADRVAVKKRLDALGLASTSLVLRAHIDAHTEEAAIRAFLEASWPLEELAQQYQEFLSLFRPVWRSVEHQREIDPEACFQIRTLLIHEFRRLTLRDPQMPAKLLPADWAGTRARVLCRNLYRVVEKGARAHLLARVETADGPLPGASPAYFTRFGGL